MRKTQIITLLAGAILVMVHGSATAIDQWPDTGWGDTDCFDNSGNTITCGGSAYPGQDGSHSGPARSYTDNFDDTVTDNVTGLMWVQDGNEASSTFNYSGAQNYANNLELEGYTDWRLPTVQELATLVDSSEFNPSITDAGTTFLNSPTGTNIMYWSITERAGDTTTAWVVNFTNGMVGIQGIITAPKANTYYVRAVRDVQ